MFWRTALSRRGGGTRHATGGRVSVVSVLIALLCFVFVFRIRERFDSVDIEASKTSGAQ
jgi:hypothetical protein